MPDIVGAVNGSNGGSNGSTENADASTLADHSDTPHTLRARTENRCTSSSTGKPETTADEPSKNADTASAGSPPTRSIHPLLPRYCNS